MVSKAYQLLRVKGDRAVLVSYRLRTTGKVVGCPVALPPDADAHLIPMSAVIKCLADYSGVLPEEIELLDVWNEK